jgi:hypothetical protein
LDSFQITEELVNNLSSKGFQGQGGNVVDDDDRRTKKPINLDYKGLESTFLVPRCVPDLPEKGSIAFKLC